MPPPIPPQSRHSVDAGHLDLLAILHFVLAGFSALGLGFMFFHWLLMKTMLSDPRAWQSDGPPPETILSAMFCLYLLMGMVLLIAGLVNLLSGLFIRKRRHRLFSIVVAGMNCMAFPLGTALGGFTLVVLLRESVRERYRLPSNAGS